jgi:hypothetical protein
METTKIAVFKGKQVRKTLHNNEWWFSVTDVIEVLTENERPRKYWNDLKLKLTKEGYVEVSEKIGQLKLQAPDGKLRLTDCANTETLFRIIQAIPSHKAEPFKRWLAKVGYERVQEIENPELATQRTRALYKSTGYARSIKVGILIILLSLIASAETVCDVNNPQPVIKSSEPISREQKENTVIKESHSQKDTLLGFGLGILGTCIGACFIAYLQNMQKRKEFYHGMQAELKQTLATMLTLGMNPDACITRDKYRLWISSCKKFDLCKEVFPLRKDMSFDKIDEATLNDATLDALIASHNNEKRQREKDGKMLLLKVVRCAFITNNISCISLIKKQERSGLLNILNYIDLINTEMQRLNFFFEKSYDKSICGENRERLGMSYKSSCQHISDLSYAAAKEIKYLLTSLDSPLCGNDTTKTE